jgi:hypothetical protein
VQVFSTRGTTSFKCGHLPLPRQLCQVSEGPFEVFAFKPRESFLNQAVGNYSIEIEVLFCLELLVILNGGVAVKD